MCHGFLRTYPPPGQPRLEGGGRHARLGHGMGRAGGAGAGWNDPTNAQWAGEDYITVAIGRDYADAAPVRAIRTAGGQDSTGRWT